MLFPDVDLNVWCRRHGLKVQLEECPCCGSDIKLDIPYVRRVQVGLCARTCKACGEAVEIYSFRSTDLKNKRLWNGFLGGKV